MNNPNQKLLGPLTMKALEKQRLFWIKRVESSCDDEDDRLLPDASPYTTKLVEYSHLRTLHGGVGMTMAHVRENYWISRQATSTSAESDQEMFCRRFQAKALQQPPPGMLPLERTVGNHPFRATVTDCFKRKQTWRRATQSKSCLRVENMAFIFIFKWKSIYLKQD